MIFSHFQTIIIIINNNKYPLRSRPHFQGWPGQESINTLHKQSAMWKESTDIQTVWKMFSNSQRLMWVKIPVDSFFVNDRPVCKLFQLYIQMYLAFFINCRSGIKKKTWIWEICEHLWCFGPFLVVTRESCYSTVIIMNTRTYQNVFKVIYCTQKTELVNYVIYSHRTVSADKIAYLSSSQVATRSC